MTEADFTYSVGPVVVTPPEDYSNIFETFFGSGPASTRPHVTETWVKRSDVGSKKIEVPVTVSLNAVLVQKPAMDNLLKEAGYIKLEDVDPMGEFSI